MQNIPMKNKQAGRTLKIGFTFLFLTLMFASCKNAAAEKSDLQSFLGFKMSQESVDKYLDIEMEAFEIPGLSIAIINDGKVVFHRTKGFANKEKKLPVTAETIFEGASISKSVFSYFVMKYVEEGKLDLDKPLFEYLPNPDIADDERYKKITARMALTHQTGFPNWREDLEDKKLKIEFEPGTEYSYSGEGFQYLAEVLRHISKTDWEGLEAIFQEKVARPLGMTHTHFIQNEYTRKHKAEPYDEDGKWLDWENDYWYKKDDGVFVAPASIHSEPIDFAKWMIAIMNEEGLTEASFEEMLRPYVSVPYDGIDVFYTLGFLTPRLPFGEIYLHSGNNEGFTSFFVMDKKSKNGYVLFTNSEYGEELGTQMFFHFITGWSPTKLLLLGSSFLLALIFLIGNVFLYLFSKNKRTKIRKNGIMISSLVILSGIGLLLLLMKLNVSIEIIYVLTTLLTGLLFLISIRALSKIIDHFRKKDFNKIELVFQFVMLVGILATVGIGLIF